MMKRKELTAAGTWSLLEYIGCSDPYPCVAMNTKTDTEHMDRQCCNGHLCTDGNSTGLFEFLLVSNLTQVKPNCYVILEFGKILF